MYLYRRADGDFRMFIMFVTLGSQRGLTSQRMSESSATFSGARLFIWRVGTFKSSRGSAHHSLVWEAWD